MMFSKTICARAFNHIYSDSYGAFRLCCHASGDPKTNPLAKYNSNVDLPFDVFHSDEMEDVRNSMVSGEHIEACSKCYDLEANGALSPRLRSNHAGTPIEPTRVTIKMRIFGNSCSLSCYMCTPYNSSTRMREFRDANINGDIYDFGSKLFTAKPKRAHFDAIARNVLDNISQVGTIYITGGEPFQLPKHYEFLEEIPDHEAKNIHVRYDTNLTVLEYKGKSIFEILKKFASFRFMVSSDHYGEKLKYIRYPIDVDQFERNLDFVQNKYNAIDNISCTVSILNFQDLDDILPYYENKFGIYNHGYTSCVIRPKTLSIENYPDKDPWIKKYTDYAMDRDKHILARLKAEGNLKNWNLGIHYLEQLDKHRGTNFRELWPEYDYIDFESGNKVPSELREQFIQKYKGKYV